MTWVLAHRGAHKDIPENTMASFAKAFEEGADGVEIDVRPTLDGALVVFHDETLERMVGVKESISALPLDKVLKVRLGGDEHIPLLEEALKFIKALSKWAVLDIKVPGFEEEIVRIIDDYEKTITTSLYFTVSKRIKSIKPSLKTAVMLWKGLNYHGEDPIELAMKYLADYIHFTDPLIIDQKLVLRAKNKGLGIIAGCSNNLKVLKRLMEIGVDFIMTDYPSILRSYELRSRGHGT